MTDNRFRFTKHALLRLPRPESGEVWYTDEGNRALKVRVPASGDLGYYFRKRINKRVTKCAIGTVEGLSVDRARAEAAKIEANVREGKEPKATPKPATAKAGELTLRTVFARYVRSVKGKLRSWRDAVALFGRHVKPHADVAVSAVDAEWLRRLHRRVTDAGTPGAANRVLALMSSVMTFHLGDGVPNPASAVRRNQENERHRTMTADEEGRFLAAVDAYEAEPAGVAGSPPKCPAKRAAKQRVAQHAKETAADLLRLLYWTGQRSGNVRAMEWAAVDLKARTWTVAARHYKTGVPHVCALPDEAVAILVRRKAAAASGAVYVFPAGNGKSKRGYFENYHHAFHRVKELAGIDGPGTHASDTLRVHDLRAGVATAMANAGENAYTIARQLGHRNIKTTERYVRQSVEDVRAAMDRVSRGRGRGRGSGGRGAA